MLKRVMRWRRFLYRKTITIAFFQWQSSLQPTKIFTFHAVTQLEPNLFFVLLLYLFILALFKKLFPSMMCVCMERHHPYKSNIGARTEFLAYSTFSNVVKTHFVCLFVCCVLFFHSLFLHSRQYTSVNYSLMYAVELFKGKKKWIWFDCKIF